MKKERVKLATLKVGDKFTVLGSDYESVATVLEKNDSVIRVSGTAYEFMITDNPIVYKILEESKMKIRTVEDIEYIGIRLSDESIKRLKSRIFCNEKTIADHVTLIHRSQFESYPEVLDELLLLSSPVRSCILKMKVTHIGWNDKCIAFKVQLMDGEEFCVNNNSHITLQVFDSGSPKDSNDINKWIEIDELDIDGTIFRKYVNE